MEVCHFLVCILFVIYNPLVCCFKYIQCGQELLKYQSGRFGPVVKYHRYRYYSVLDECTYKIRSRAGQSKITILNWLKFNIRSNMPSCLGSYVEVFIG